MDSGLERGADEYRKFLRQVYGKDIPVYTDAVASLEDGMVRLDLMGSDGVTVKRLNLEQVIDLIDKLQVALERSKK